MRIALTSPFAHPDVWRGAERYLHDFGRFLVARGHEVTIVATSTRATHTDPDEYGTPVRYERRSARPAADTALVDVIDTTVLPVARALRDLAPDVVQAHGFPDAAGARRSRRSTGAPYVIWAPGTVRGGTFRRRPLRKLIFRHAVGGAARIHSLSRYAASTFQEFAGLRTDVVYPAVDTTLYAGPRPGGGPPTIVCTAAADDPRKRVGDLVAAFPAVRSARPDTRLVLAVPRAAAAREMVRALGPADRANVEVRENLPADALADVYRGATVSVLPSIKEAFGLVTIESLAAGAPVVGARSGATPELVSSDEVGRLYEPGDVEALTAALLAGLELGLDPSTAARCRSHAAQWSWDVRGPIQEDLLLSTLT